MSLTLFTAGLSLISTAAAFTKPVGDSPVGNAIYQPGLNSVVPAGTPFSITWEPTKDDCATVDIVLLKGPSTNAVPISTIVERTDNNGTFVWTPSTDLAPQTVGYGIQLICDASGAYQYSTQFGISNDNYVAKASTSSSASSAASSSSLSSYGASSTSAYYHTTVVSSYTTYCSSATSFAIANKTYTVSEATTLTITDCPCTITKSATAGPVTGVPSSGYLPANSSIIHPTGPVTVPSSLRTTKLTSLTTSASSSSETATSASSTSAVASPTSTGAASQLGASLVSLIIAAGAVAFAL